VSMAAPMQADLFGSHDPVGTLARRVEPWATIGSATLYHGDSLELLEFVPDLSIDVIFADPPYFLSNGGTTCQIGERVSVDKGEWDESPGLAAMHEFNMRWLAACRRVLKHDGTIWVSGTHHVIYSVGWAMQLLSFSQLNEVIWEKPNPPPNLGCRCLTHSHETLIWAAREPESGYHFDYARLRAENGDKQLKDVWRFTAPSQAEKEHGKHPTQKPLALLDRVLSSSCRAGATVLDPFNGSGTTGVAAARLGLRYLGFERELEYIKLTSRRLHDVTLERAADPVEAIADAG